MPAPDDATEPDAARRVLERAEREMQRVLLDLHDGAVQYVYAALSQLGALHSGLAQSGADAALLDRAERVRTLLESALGEFRALLGAARPPAFETADLRALLEGLALQHEAASDARVSVALEAGLPTPGAATRIALYRVVQEALANAARHGHARHARVRVSPEERAGMPWLRLAVEDDGVGFDPHAAVAAGHYGLAGMRDRVAMLGGRLAVESRPGAGTTVVVEVPSP